MSELQIGLKYVYDLNELVGPLRNESNSGHPLFQPDADYLSVGVYVGQQEQPAAITYFHEWGPRQSDPFASLPMRGVLKVGRMVGLGDRLPPASGWPGCQAGIGLYELPTAAQLPDEARSRIGCRGIIHLLEQKRGQNNSLINVYAAVAANNSAAQSAYTRCGFRATGRQGEGVVFGAEPQKVTHNELVFDFYQYRRHQYLDK